MIHKKKNGFTLVELLIVIIIISILSLIALPSLINVYSRQRELGATQQVMGIFRQARQEAISKRSNVSININTTTMEFTVLRSDGSVVTQQKVDNKFKSFLIGIKNTSNTFSSASGFGFTSIGVPFIKPLAGPNYLLINTQSIILSFSSTQDILNINNANTVGFLLRSNGIAFLCQNTPDGQIKQACNG